MIQKNMNEENTEIRDKAYELYEKHGFKDGNEFADWLEAERQVGTITRSSRNRQIRNILFAITGILCVIVVILLMMLFKKNSRMEMSQKNLSDLKVMMLVLDPKADEKVAVFGDTHFDFDKATLTDEAKGLLDKDVRTMNENPGMHVRMAGYTSAEGTEAGNQALSEKRANTVRNYLIGKGIAPEKITVVGYGRTKPSVYEVNPDNINSKEAKANMRVLFEIIVGNKK
jgi:outer membrane protein OmpA-like peptidoglycan-associated protein